MKIYGVKNTGYSAGSQVQNFANHGMVTHLLIDIEASAQTGASTSVSVASGCKVHCGLSGRGGTKIIDGLTLYELASIADQEGGAVVFDDSITATGAFKIRLAVPIGAFRLDDGDSLDVELVWPNDGTQTYTGFKSELGIADDGTRVETGIYQYTRSTLTFGASNGTLDRAITDPDVVKVWIHDTGSVWERATVQVPEGFEGGGTAPRELWEAMTFQNSEASSIKEGDALWNAAILVYSEDSVNAHGSGCTVLVSNGSATGTVTLLMLANRVDEKRVSLSTAKNALKIREVTERLERSAPLKAKAFRHIGLIEPASVAKARANVITAAMTRGS